MDGLAAGTGPGDSGLGDFRYSLDFQGIEVCPAGHVPVGHRALADGAIVAEFDRNACQGCPFAGSCPTRERLFGSELEFEPERAAPKRRQQEQQGDAFKTTYRIRSGIEATNSTLKGAFGADRLRVRGKPRVALTMLLKALGLNVRRCMEHHLTVERAAAAGVDAAAAALPKRVETCPEPPLLRLDRAPTSEFLQGNSTCASGPARSENVSGYTGISGDSGIWGFCGGSTFGLKKCCSRSSVVARIHAVILLRVSAWIGIELRVYFKVLERIVWAGGMRMAKHIEIVLCDPTDEACELSLFYSLRAIAIADRYFLALQKCVNREFAIRDPERFYNFADNRWDKPRIVEELNRQVDLINGYAAGTIETRAFVGMSQPHLNHLHSYFERLRGAVLRPGAFFLGASASVQDALEDFNLLIHRYECYERALRHVEEGNRPIAYAVLTFRDPRPRYKLEEQDYRYFRRRPVFGALQISYCELGKPIWDAYQDRDEVVGDDNIRPLRYYSGDAVLRFTATQRYRDYVKEQAGFYRWWYSRAASRLRQLGFRPHDRHNAIGDITVGRLNRSRGRIANLSDEEIVALVGRYARFKAARCHVSE